MTIELWIFALIFIPMAIIIGIATATIGYTAWNIVVPLLFIGFGFEPFDAIFISLFIDFIDSVYLTIRYTKSGNVDFKKGLIWGLLAWIGVGIGALFGYDLIMGNQGLLRGGVAFFIFIMGFVFLNKGRKEMLKAKASANFETPDTKKPTKLEERMKKLPPKAIPVAMFIGVLISGLMVGVLGIGSGMNFVILLMILFSFEILRATGTGCLMMALVTSFMMMIISRIVHFDLIWTYLIIGVIFALLGTILGATFALRLNREKLNYLVGGSMLIAGTISTILGFVL